MDDFREKLIAWYDKHISAAWYKSWSLYVGMLAALFPYLLNILDAAVAQWPDVATALKLSPGTTAVVQILLATVVLPAARAYQQKSTREATLLQAAKTGQITTTAESDQIQIKVDAKTPAVQVPTQPAPL